MKATIFVTLFLAATTMVFGQERIAVRASEAQLENLGITSSERAIPNWRIFSGDSSVISELRKQGIYAEIDQVSRAYGMNNRAGQFTGAGSPTLQWWLTGNGGMWPGDFQSAWNITTGSSSIKVGVLDSGSPEKNGVWTSTGLDSSRFIVGPSFVTNAFGLEVVGDSDYANVDYLGHSTHIEGIIAAERNNGVGVVGIDQHCRVEVYKVLNYFGMGYDSWIADGIYRATEDSCRIINLSLGGPYYSRILEDAVRYASEHGVLVVVAGGNDASEVQSFPAFFNNFSTSDEGIPGVVSVGSVNMNGNVSWFSDWGYFIDVYAPGGTGHFPSDSADILSVWPSYYVFLDDTLNGEPMARDYAYLAGTSMSAPMVVGTASLMLATNPNLTNVQLKSIICSTADTVETSNGPIPILDPGKAVAVAKNFGKQITVVKSEALNVLKFALVQNYPNPFNPTTTISFSLPRNERVTLRVYNTLGQLVKTLIDGTASSGRNEVSFDGAELASGVYFYRLQTAESLIVKKMLLLK